MYNLDTPNSVAVGATLSINVLSSSMLPLTIFSSTPDVCQIIQDVGPGDYIITTYYPGTCIIVATQSGDSITDPIEQVVEEFEVVKIPQKITLQNPGTITLPSGNQIGFQLSAKEDYSNSQPVITSDTPLVCTVEPGTLIGTAMTTGICRLTATMDGDAHHQTAIPVSVEFDVRGTAQGEKLINVLVPQNQIVSGTTTQKFSVK